MNPYDNVATRSMSQFLARQMEEAMLASGLTPEQYLLREAYCAQIQAQAEAQVAEQNAQLDAINRRASLRGPYKTVLVEDGVEYSVPTESLQRGAYDRKRGT